MEQVEHPTVRCPKCRRGAIDVAPDYDPFAELDQPDDPWSLPPMPTRIDICATCPNGHLFFVSETRIAREVARECVAVGTPEWEERIARVAAGEDR